MALLPRGGREKRERADPYHRPRYQGARKSWPCRTDGRRTAGRGALVAPAPQPGRPGRARHVGRRAPGPFHPCLGCRVGVPRHSQPRAADRGVRTLGREPVAEHRRARLLLAALDGEQHRVLPRLSDDAGGGAPDPAQLGAGRAGRLRDRGLLRRRLAVPARRGAPCGALPPHRTRRGLPHGRVHRVLVPGVRDPRLACRCPRPVVARRAAGGNVRAGAPGRGS